MLSCLFAWAWGETCSQGRSPTGRADIESMDFGTVVADVVRVVLLNCRRRSLNFWSFLTSFGSCQSSSKMCMSFPQRSSGSNHNDVKLILFCPDICGVSDLPVTKLYELLRPHRSDRSIWVVIGIQMRRACVAQALGIHERRFCTSGRVDRRYKCTGAVL